MLTSFFGNSRPSTAAICLAVMLAGVLAMGLSGSNEAIELADLGAMLAVLAVLVLCWFVTNFIVGKNKLAGSNSYGVMAFAVLTLLLPDFLKDREVVFSCLFMMLAVRRMFSLQTEKNTERKVLDASIWIGLAALLLPANLLLLFPLYWSMSQRSHLKLRHYFVPLIGLGAVALITAALLMAFADLSDWWQDWSRLPKIEWTYYINVEQLPLVVAILAMVISGSIRRYLAYKRVNRLFRANYNLLTVLILTAFIMVVFSQGFDGREWFLLLPFTAVLQANNLATLRRLWLRETVLWLMFLLPIFRFFLPEIVT